MLVGQRMSQPVITIHPDMAVQDALNLMRKENIRRFPVVTDSGALVGIVSERDLLHASPSNATSLSVWELNYLISKIKVASVMSSKVVTVTEDTPVEEAARIMADNKIGGLPVERDAKVVGIITETDLFKLFLELLGARETGTRLTALVTDVPGELAKLTSAVRDAGGNIIALVTFLGETTENRGVTLKVGRLDGPALRKAVEPVVEKILDVR
ncbi:MAG TPA: CBS domain-containing protein [Anaerolineales bacterium]|nr:CBS domain-containing protein [Anaerolineales bacterium]